jgi:cysteine synthase
MSGRRDSIPRGQVVSAGNLLASDGLTRPYIPLMVGNTPVATVRVRIGDRRARLHLKLESFNPCGSIKDRTAVTLYESAVQDVDPAVGLVESTSGNLGVALATIAHAANVPFTAVIDPRTPSVAMQALQRLGARLVIVSEDDGYGGYLINRLRTVQTLIAEQPALCWTNQYENPANPRAHELGTGPELARQVPFDSVVLAAVSTGGTLAGLRRFAAAMTGWTVIAVDVAGSHAVRHVDGRRVLPGIGSSRRASFDSVAVGRTEWADADEAVSACIWLLESCGIGVGASSGALIASALRLIVRDRLDDVVCVCPDGARNYLNTVYSETWRRANDITIRPPSAVCESVEWEMP